MVTDALPSEAGSHQNRRVPLTSMRRAIIERVTRSKRDIPHFYVTQEIDMSVARQLLAKIKAAYPDRRVTLTHLIMHTVVATLTRHPRLNARLTEDSIEEIASVHLGFVVGLEDGMIIPVLHEAETLTFLQLVERATDLEKRALARRLQAGDLTGRTFTISNMGMLGIDAFQAVISPPDAAILAIGRLIERPVVRDGALAVAPTVLVTLSCDHRIVDGAQAARFMTDWQASLQNDDPSKLLDV